MYGSEVLGQGNFEVNKIVRSRFGRSRGLSDTRTTDGQAELPFASDGNWGSLPNSKVRRPRSGAAFAWAHTYTSFSLDFAKAALAHLGATPTSVILDPFLGSGTTMLAAAIHGCSATGIDISPFSALLSRGRMATTVEVRRVRSHLKRDPAGRKFPAPQCTALPASDMAYAQGVVQGICRELRVARENLLSALLADDVGDYDSEVVSLLSLVMAARDCAKLERGSNPIWYRRPSVTSKHLRHKTLRAAAMRWGDTIANDLLTSMPLFRRGHRIVLADFTTLDWGTPEFDICITSPPYLNRLDYVIAHLPELSILDLLAPVNFDDLRRSMMGTTKIVRKATGDIPAEWGDACGRTLKSVANHPSYASRRYYYHTYHQYFAAFYNSLTVLRALMRRSCKGLIVLQDSYYKDLKIPTPQICIEMMRSLSFKAAIVRTAAVRAHMGRMSPVQTAYAPQKTLHECLVYFG